MGNCSRSRSMRVTEPSLLSRGVDDLGGHAIEPAHRCPKRLAHGPELRRIAHEIVDDVNPFLYVADVELDVVADHRERGARDAAPLLSKRDELGTKQHVHIL